MYILFIIKCHLYITKLKFDSLVLDLQVNIVIWLKNCFAQFILFLPRASPLFYISEMKYCYNILYCFRYFGHTLYYLLELIWRVRSEEKTSQFEGTPCVFTFLAINGHSMKYGEIDSSVVSTYRIWKHRQWAVLYKIIIIIIIVYLRIMCVVIKL